MDSISPELSFIPSSPPYEITDKARGQKVVFRINRFLRTLSPNGLHLRAKLDPHHNEWGPDTTYCVEIVPWRHLLVNWFTDEGEWRLVREGLTKLFGWLKQHEGLFPSVRMPKPGTKGKTLIHQSGGGCHLHYGADLFSGGSDWYDKMKRFHQNLVVDFANKPFIRWLFQQWFADESGLVAVTPEAILSRKKKTRPSVKALFRRACCGSYPIEPRFMHSSKSSYLTFEFRLFSMVDSPDELRAIVKALHAWVEQIWTITSLGKALTFDLNRRNVVPMTTLRGSRTVVTNWLESLGLLWQDYSCFHERHYVNRIKFGRLI